MTYEQAIEKIEVLEARGWRLGLDRMAAFCEHAELNRFLGGSRRPQYIHVAGTNGKGSTTGFVESLLRSGGASTGAFYSPFIQNYRERIQSDGQLISEEDLTRISVELLNDAESFQSSVYGGITKFEFEAALGFKYWGERGCEWVALEVGLGGRLDATNVVVPKCSIIVSIGLDHTAILGDTLEKIAFEKAGIIKPGIPVVIGQMPSEARNVIEARAEELGAPAWRFGVEIQLSQSDEGFTVTTPNQNYRALKSGIAGDMQPHNAALAIAALELSEFPISEESVKNGIEKADLPGRFQRVNWRGTEFVLDGAHNPDAATHLINGLHRVFGDRGPAVLIANALSGHDAEQFIDVMEGKFVIVIACPIANPRAMKAEDFLALTGSKFSQSWIAADVNHAVEMAAELAGKDGYVVVTGSNYLVGESLNLLSQIQ